MSGNKYDTHQMPDGTWYCSCPAWKFQKKPPAHRVCKHMPHTPETRQTPEYITRLFRPLSRCKDCPNIHFSWIIVPNQGIRVCYDGLRQVFWNQEGHEIRICPRILKKMPPKRVNYVWIGYLVGLTKQQFLLAHMTGHECSLWHHVEFEALDFLPISSQSRAHRWKTRFQRLQQFTYPLPMEIHKSPLDLTCPSQILVITHHIHEGVCIRQWTGIRATKDGKKNYIK